MKTQLAKMVAIVIASLWIGVGCGPSTTPVPSSITVTFEGNQCIYTGPAAVPVGELSLTMIVKDQGHESFAVYVLTLDPDKTPDDLKAWPSTDKPGWAQIVTWLEGGASGNRSIFNANAEKGPIYLACFSKPPEAKVGVLGPIRVGK